MREPARPELIGTLLLLAVLRSFTAVCQPPNDDCAGALTLCAQQALSGDNTGSQSLIPGFCPGTDDLVWFTFTTNSQGGVVDIALTGIDCAQVPGMDNELSVVVLAGDGSCAPASFTSVSNCANDSMDLVVSTQALAPDTPYWIIVSGTANNGATLNANCSFDITASGPGMDIVDVDFDAGPDQEIGEGEVTQLEASGGTSYDWSPTSGLSGNTVPDPFASPTETTSYTVTTEINGCTYTDQVLVEVVRRIAPPNTFTPNGDGINDTWTITGLDQYPGAEVIIYDRWGQRVFRSTGYGEPWDGTNNGVRLPTATYYYHIRLNQVEGNSPPYTGSISIVR
ncbi:MAG: gliding motility-associated C-terminal domain-containing protein [Flavobacteriales bacterium]